MDQDTIYLETKIGFCPMLDFDRDNGLHIVGEFEVHGGETEYSQPYNFETIMDEMLGSAIVRGDYQFVYCVAHEFRRFGEDLIEVAQKMEDGNNALTDRYDMVKGDLDE